MILEGTVSNMGARIRRIVIGASVTLAVGLVAACGPKSAPPPPPPPPPPPKPALVIPPKPYPPNQASRDMPVPAIGADGLFQSVNRGISPAQVTWNLRSAYNVAALSCPVPARDEITANYRVYLKRHAKALTAANRKIDAEWKARHGAGFIAHREKYMTNVYNHFALPPTMGEFCKAALAMSRDEKLIKVGELDAFSARSLPSIEIVYDDFFRRYAQYRTDLAEWTAKYGALTTQ